MGDRSASKCGTGVKRARMLGLVMKVRTSETLTPVMATRIGNVMMMDRIHTAVHGGIVRCVVVAMKLVCDLVDQVGSLVLDVFHGGRLGVGGVCVGGV